MNREPKVIDSAQKQKMCDIVNEFTALSFASMLGTIKKHPELEKTISVEWICSVAACVMWPVIIQQIDIQRTDLYILLTDEAITLDELCESLSKDFAEKMLNTYLENIN